jgi:hypothetical protein
VPFASTAANRFEILSLDQILSRHAPEFLTDPPLLVDGGLNGAFGRPGTGKTQFATILSLAMATGSTIAGIRPRRQGPVLYLDGERSLNPRLRAAAVAHGVDLAGVPIVGLGGELLDAFDFDSVDAVVHALKARSIEPVLTVIDTAAIHQRCDENSPDVNIVVQNLLHYRRATGSAILSLMHPSEGNPGRERGANSFRAAADVMLQVVLAESTVTVTMSKNRFAPLGESWRFHMVEVPDVDKGVTLTAVTAGELSERDRHVFEALPPDGATFTTWKSLAVTANWNENQFKRSVKALRDGGRIRKVGETYYHA